MTEPLPDLATRFALTVPEAAAALGVSERHLRDMMPELPSVHLGKRVLIPVDSLREWLQDRARTEAGRTDKIADEIMESLNNVLHNQ